MLGSGRLVGVLFLIIGLSVGGVAPGAPWLAPPGAPTDAPVVTGPQVEPGDPTAAPTAGNPLPGAAVVAGARSAGAWYENAWAAPNASDRWTFAYSALGEAPGPGWRPVTGERARVLTEARDAFSPAWGAYTNPDLPRIGQERPLSCEAAVARMILSSYGWDYTEDEVLAALPLSDNPHEGFVGDVNTPAYNGNPRTGGFGAYAEALAPIIEQLSRGALEVEVLYGLSYAELYRRVRAGERIAVWLSKWDADHPAREDWTLEREGRVVARFVGHQHVALVAGNTATGQLVLYDPYPASGLVPGVPSTGQQFVVDIIPNWEDLCSAEEGAPGRMTLAVRESRWAPARVTARAGHLVATQGLVFRWD